MFIYYFSASYTGSSSDEDDVNPREKDQVKFAFSHNIRTWKFLVVPWCIETDSLRATVEDFQSGITIELDRRSTTLSESKSISDPVLIWALWNSKLTWNMKCGFIKFNSLTKHIASIVGRQLNNSQTLLVTYFQVTVNLQLTVNYHWPVSLTNYHWLVPIRGCF